MHCRLQLPWLWLKLHMSLNTVICTGLLAVTILLVTLSRLLILTADCWLLLYRGNILLSRNDSITTKFILKGKEILFRTFGLSISIIDFTLSRINTGEILLIFFLSLNFFSYIRGFIRTKKFLIAFAYRRKHTLFGSIPGPLSFQRSERW